MHREANSVCICMCIYVHLCEYIHGGQILMLGIFLNQPDTGAGYLSQSLPALFS